MFRKASFILIVFALIIFCSNFLLAQTNEALQTKVDEYIKNFSLDFPRKIPEKLNNIDTTKSQEYNLLSLKFEDLESTYGKICGLIYLEKSLKEKIDLMVEILQEEPSDKQYEIFNKKFQISQAEQILGKVQLSKVVKEVALLQIKDYIDNLGLVSYEKDLKESKKIDFRENLDFYSKILDKLNEEIVPVYDAYKNELEKYKEEFKVLVFKYIEFEIITSASEDFSANVKNFKKEEAVFICVNYLAEAWPCDEKLVFRHEISSGSKKLAADKVVFYPDPIGNVDFPAFDISPQQEFGSYTIKVELDYKDFSPKVKKVNFQVINPEFYIGNIYTAGDLKTEKTQGSFKVLSPVVFVIDHTIKMDLDTNAVKIIDFSIFSPEGNLVSELSSKRKLKAAQGRWYARLAKRIPPNLKPGLYNFIGTITVQNKVIKAATQFEIIK